MARQWFTRIRMSRDIKQAEELHRCCLKGREPDLTSATPTSCCSLSLSDTLYGVADHKLQLAIFLQITMNDYKASKEAFVSGMIGSTVFHVNMISSVALVCIPTCLST
jgi:hypothetical protein